MYLNLYFQFIWLAKQENHFKKVLTLTKLLKIMEWLITMTSGALKKIITIKAFVAAFFKFFVWQKGSFIIDGSP